MLREADDRDSPKHRTKRVAQTAPQQTPSDGSSSESSRKWLPRTATIGQPLTKNSPVSLSRISILPT
jgi:hypothetical protein